MEFQKYARIQENKVQECVDLLKKMSSFEREEDEQEEAEVDENLKGDDEEYFNRSHSESSIPVGYDEDEGSEYEQDGFVSKRFDNKEQDQSPMSDEASPLLPTSPKVLQGYQNSRIPRPPPPRRAVIHEDVKKQGLPLIPRHEFSKDRFAPQSKVKIFQEKLPNYNNVIESTGHGKNTKQRAPSAFVRKPRVALPPIHQNTQYGCQQSSLKEISHHQDFAQSNDSLAFKRSTIKGIVKPNLIRKDLMKLRDPTVRPRTHKQTAVITQELVVNESITHQRVLPMIPRPPPRPNNNKIHASGRSRVPILPTIQQHQRMSGIPRLWPPPEPPMVPRLRPGASHRTYPVRDRTGLRFRRRQ